MIVARRARLRSTRSSASSGTASSGSARAMSRASGSGSTTTATSSATTSSGARCSTTSQLLLCVPILIVLAALVAAVLLRPRAGLEGLPDAAVPPLRPVDPRRRDRVRLRVPAQRARQHRARHRRARRARRRTGSARRTRALWTIMAVIVWKELGFGIIVFLARLMSVSEEMYEAARVDGAGWWQRFRHVTLPQLVPAIVFFAVVETITMLSWVFAYVYVMTAGRARELDRRHRVLHLPAGLLERGDRHRLGGRGDAAGGRERASSSFASGPPADRRPRAMVDRPAPEAAACSRAMPEARAPARLRGASRSCRSTSCVVNSFKTQAEYSANPYGLPDDADAVERSRDAFKGGDLCAGSETRRSSPSPRSVLSTRRSPRWPPTRIALMRWRPGP